jgi:hypothetical protein
VLRSGIETLLSRRAVIGSSLAPQESWLTAQSGCRMNTVKSIGLSYRPRVDAFVVRTPSE